MCDAAWDGDMYDPTTPSGKSVFHQGPDYYVDGKPRWHPEPLIFQDSELAAPQQDSEPTMARAPLFERLRHAFRVLLGEE